MGCAADVRMAADMPSRIGIAETTLLCACARRSAQIPGRQPVAIPDSTLNWPALLHTANAHGVGELLWAALSPATGEVPADVLMHLERRVIEATAENLKRTTELAGLLATFSNHGIRALAFKGPVLAAGVYGHLGRRVSSDLDILIRRQDVPLIRPLLIARGYTMPPRVPGRCRSLLDGLVPEVGRVDEWLPGRPEQTAIDVHVRFASWRFAIDLDTDAVFERSGTVDVAGHSIATLDVHDLLLALAIHGMMHNWWPLRLVSDIDAVSELVTDWAAVTARAEAAGMRRVLWVALLLAQRLLGTALPPDVAARASSDRRATDIAAFVAGRLFAIESGDAPWRHRPLLRSYTPDSWPHRLRFYARDSVYVMLKWPWNTRQGWWSHAASPQV